VNHDRRVLDFAPIAVVLTDDARGRVAALGGPRFVNRTDRFVVGMVPRDNLPTAISHLLLIPLDRFEKAL
jgi:hypothetical protein